MNQNSWRLALAAAGAAALLAGCGGGSDDGDNRVPIGTGGGSTQQLPASALQSSNTLVAYLIDLIANRTDETSEPIVLGDAVLPASDTIEPL